MPVSQHLQGDPRPRIVPVATATAIPLGDVTLISSGNAVPVSTIAWDTNLATTQSAVRAAFIGVSAQRKEAGVARVYGNSKDNTIRVNTGGVFEFDCALASDGSSTVQFNVGDLVGVYASDNAGGPTLDVNPQLLTTAAAEANAIGRVAEKNVPATKRVKVELLSTLQPAARQS
jgi:hypothetical protein